MKRRALTPGMSSSEVAVFAALVRQGLGLNVDDMPVPSLTEALARRAAVHGWPPHQYVAWLAGNLCWPETGGLASELTVSETFFFRDSGQMRAFTDLAMPERLRARAEERRLRILSAGCSTGEEPYSLAVLLRESRVLDGWDTSIQGVDVNPRVLEHARLGRYSGWSLRQTEPHLRDRWFDLDRGDYVLAPSIRAGVSFRERNLVVGEVCADDPVGYDVIFCRNLLMYLTPENFGDLAAKLTRALAPGGFLFLGHAETLRGLTLDLQLHHSDDAFFYQRPYESRSRSVRTEPGVHSTSGEWGVPRARGVPRWNRFGVATADAAEAAAAVGTLAPVSASPAPGSAPTAFASPPDLSGPLAHFEQERFAQSLAGLDGLPADVAGHPDALLLRAVVLTATGDLAGAEAACRRIVGLDAYAARAHHALATCREAMGDDNGAMKHDRLAAHLDPTFAMPRLHLGLLARRNGDHLTARTELAKALTLMPRERAERLQLFGGGFTRSALTAMCRAELSSCGGGS